MLDLLPADLANGLRKCLTRKRFDQEQFDQLLASRPGLNLFRRELIDDVYMELVERIETRRERMRLSS